MIIEECIRNYLANKLDVPVYMEKPENKPEKYVIVQKTGGGISEHIWRAIVAIQSYADSMFDAAELNQEAIQAMLGIIQLDEISSCKLNSSYEYTDTSEKKYRYQAVFDLVNY